MTETSEPLPLTPEQIENWRRILVGMLGPYALIMPASQIEAVRSRFQGMVNELEESDG